jgi:hypothetical protein
VVFSEAIQSSKFFIGDYLIGRIVEKPILPLALPFSGSDGRAGAVYISLDLDWLARYFQSDRQINNDATLAIDRNGVILVPLPDNARDVGAKFAEAYDPIFANGPGTAEIAGVDGIHRILGYAPVQYPPSGLFIGVGLTTATAFAAVERCVEGRVHPNRSRPRNRPVGGLAGWPLFHFPAGSGISIGHPTTLTDPLPEPDYLSLLCRVPFDLIGRVVQLSSPKVQLLNNFSLDRNLRTFPTSFGEVTQSVRFLHGSSPERSSLECVTAYQPLLERVRGYLNKQALFRRVPNPKSP